jgi:hypothetical protein
VNSIGVELNLLPLKQLCKLKILINEKVTFFPSIYYGMKSNIRLISLTVAIFIIASLSGCNSCSLSSEEARKKINEPRIYKLSETDTIINIFPYQTPYEQRFQWEDIELCLKDTLQRKDFINHKVCPKCGLESQKLLWIKFRSPDWTWEEWCGREGPLSICPKCNIQVQFIMTLMN